MTNSELWFHTGKLIKIGDYETTTSNIRTHIEGRYNIGGEVINITISGGAKYEAVNSILAAIASSNLVINVTNVDKARVYENNIKDIREVKWYEKNTNNYYEVRYKHGGPIMDILDMGRLTNRFILVDYALGYVY